MKSPYENQTSLVMLSIKNVVDTFKLDKETEKAFKAFLHLTQALPIDEAFVKIKADCPNIDHSILLPCYESLYLYTEAKKKLASVISKEDTKAILAVIQTLGKHEGLAKDTGPVISAENITFVLPEQINKYRLLE